MIKSNLVNAFNYDLNNNNNNIEDYNVFQDKEALDNLRKRILERLGDVSYANGLTNRETILKVINEETLNSNLSNLERSHLYNIIDNEINGYGPLTELLNDNSVAQIMVNAPDEIYVLTDGKMVKDPSVSFINNDHIIRTIKKMLKGTNINLDDVKTVSTRLSDGSTINIVNPPLSAKGPILTIKKFNKEITSLDELLKLGTLTPYMARFLEASVKAKLNILICGGSDSGKTILLNTLGNLIDDSERIITLENVSELQINKPNIIHFNSDNSQDVLGSALKMYPSTLIIGELTKDLIYPTLNLMNNTDKTVLATILASDNITAINKIETNCMREKEVTSTSVRKVLYNNLDLMVSIKEMPDHKHKITSICEFNLNKDNDIVLKEIFAYKVKEILPNNEVNGEFSMFKYIPRAYQKIKESGNSTLDDIFNK